MKKFFTALALLAFISSYSQNNFPSNGQVTIGTSTATPGTALDVNGRVMIDSCLTVKDSLVVESRIRAKDKLIVDDKAVFKNDALVKLDFRTNGDARFDNQIRVDGIAKLNGDVKMENLGAYNGAFDDVEVLLVKNNGQVKKVSLSNLTQYQGPLGNAFACLEDVNGNIINANWLTGVNKVTVCPGVDVGIGTQNPNYILDVRNLAYLAKIKIGTGNPNSPENALINAYSNTSQVELVNIGNQISGLQTYEERFTISNTGEVAITNVGSGPALTVNNGNGHALEIFDNSGSKILQLENGGLLHARAVKIDIASWPDYVFDNEYELMSLKDLESFIKKNHHLPKIPNAGLIQSAGLDIGKIQQLQMEKIEELTLYTIALNEEIKNVKDENRALKIEMNLMKEELAEIKSLIRE